MSHQFSSLKSQRLDGILLWISIDYDRKMEEIAFWVYWKEWKWGCIVGQTHCGFLELEQIQFSFVVNRYNSHNLVHVIILRGKCL